MSSSARGLFRATGNVARDVPVMLLDGTFEKGPAAREKDDFYPTPPEPTRSLLKVEGARLADATVAGFSGMARVIADFTGADANRPLQITTSPAFAASWP